MRSLFVCLALAGCAQATSNPGGGTGVDASVSPDSSTTMVDAAIVTNPDAPVGPCTTMTRNILLNGNFDGTPAGVDWQETPINAMYPIVTADTGGVPAQSPTTRAWLGGFEVAAASNKDSLYQDIAIPAMTSKLELKGFYEVRTGELPGGNVYDSATIELVAVTTNTRLELVQTVDDNGPTTAWTAFSKVFTGDYSGQTVRLRISSASDSLDPTSFFFDSFELLATHCQ